MFLIVSSLMITSIRTYNTTGAELVKLKGPTPCYEAQEYTPPTRFFYITTYCSCAKCCGVYAKNRGAVVRGASGRPLVAGYSVAGDLPFGTRINLEGYGVVEVMDRGGAVHGNHLDLYMNSHSEALSFGNRTLKGEILWNN